MTNKIDLNGKRAVVTGGAQGIGYAVAERYLESGASVSLWDFDKALMEKAVEALSAKGVAHGVAVDVTNPDAVAKATAETTENLGGIEILVCNAGIAGPSVPTVDYTIEDWNSVVNLDLNAVFYCCKAVVPGMIEQNYGRIVNVASIAGKEGNPNACAYSAAKAGVIGFTKSLGKELAKHDIAVNCITPAAAKTAIFDQISQQHIDFMLSKIPRERFLMVDEVAAMVAWLSSAENSFTTGGVFDISGGRATY